MPNWSILIRKILKIKCLQFNSFFIWQVRIFFNFFFQLVFIYYNLFRHIGKMWHFYFSFFLSFFGHTSTKSDASGSKFLGINLAQDQFLLSLDHCYAYFIFIFCIPLFFLKSVKYFWKLWTSVSEEMERWRKGHRC